MPRRPPAPSSIGKHGARLWARILGEFEVSDPELALVESACGTYERLVQAQEAINADGLVRDGKVHPAAAVARDSANLLGKLMKQLGVSLEDEAPVKPFRHGARPRPRPAALRDVG